MEVHVGAGAVVDLATSDEITKSTNSLVDAITGAEAHPLRFTQIGGRTGQVSDPLDLGSPPIGRIWYIRSITVCGSDAFTTVGGGAMAALCVGDLTAFSVAHVRIPALTIPQFRTTSDDGLWVKSNESVYVVTTALGVNSLFVTLQVEEWNESDVSMKNPGFTPLT